MATMIALKSVKIPTGFEPKIPYSLDIVARWQFSSTRKYHRSTFYRYCHFISQNIKQSRLSIFEKGKKWVRFPFTCKCSTLIGDAFYQNRSANITKHTVLFWKKLLFVIEENMKLNQSGNTQIWDFIKKKCKPLWDLYSSNFPGDGYNRIIFLINFEVTHFGMVATFCIFWHYGVHRRQISATTLLWLRLYIFLILLFFLESYQHLCRWSFFANILCGRQHNKTHILKCVIFHPWFRYDLCEKNQI